MLCDSGIAICCVSQALKPWSVKAFKVDGLAPHAACPKKREACSGVRPAGVGSGGSAVLPLPLPLPLPTALSLPPAPQAASNAEGAAAKSAKFEEPSVGASADCVLG
jgi:hypothetical protein